MVSLFEDFGDDACTDGAAAFADGEAQFFFHGDRGDQFDVELQVVARHHHFGAVGKLNRAGHIGGAEVELRAVVGEERRVAAAFFLGQNIGLCLEFGVRLDAGGLAQHLTALHALTVDTAQQDADVVASLATVQQLAEHLDAGADRLLGPGCR